jgi:hypothetical protein
MSAGVWESAKVVAEDRAAIVRGAYSKHRRQQAVGKRIERDPRDADPISSKNSIKHTSLFKTKLNAVSILRVWVTGISVSSEPMCGARDIFNFGHKIQISAGPCV